MFLLKYIQICFLGKNSIKGNNKTTPTITLDDLDIGFYFNPTTNAITEDVGGDEFFQ